LSAQGTLPGTASATGTFKKIEAEGSDVARYFSCVLLEREEHPGLVEPNGAIHEKSEREQRLTGTGAATDQRRPAFWQPAARDLVEAANSGKGFRQLAQGQFLVEQFHGAVRDRGTIHGICAQRFDLVGRGASARSG
jgi:hypothetical protein